MKTTELRTLYKSLSELNNGFTHYSFVWNQFSNDYQKILKKSPEKLTKDYFANNPYKRIHNIRFSELDNEHSKTNETLIKGIFLLIYTSFEGYLKDLLEFARSVDSKIEPLESKIQDSDDDFILIDKVLNRIKVDKKQLQPELSLTLDYIRLKRNRLIHNNANSISRSLNDLIKFNGKTLNDYWKTRLPGELQGIDFRNKDSANKLSFNTIIDFINIFRGISNQIDQLVIQKLTLESIIRNLIIPKFKHDQRQKINGLETDRLVSKFKKYCETEYSLEINNDQIDILKSSIVQR